MRYLVTGGAGFIGSNLVRNLLQDPANEVVNLDALTYAGNLDSLRDVEGNSRYQFLHIDLRDGPAVRQAVLDLRPDGIFHLAAESHVDRSIDGPGDFIHTNILGTYHLLQAAVATWKGPNSKFQTPSGKSPRFLHVSTDEVYGSLREEDPGFTETTRYNPHSPYSASKAASDHLVRAWHDTYGLPVIVANCSNNYGPWQFPEKLIPMVILRALAGRPIPVYGNGGNIRDWLHVEDQCRALKAVMGEGTPGASYNIGGGNEVRNIDLVRSLCRILDELLADRRARAQPIPPREAPSSLNTEHSPLESLIRFVPDRPGHDFRYAIDDSKIRTELDWHPRHDFDSGLRSTVKWYLENQDWWRKILDHSSPLERLGVV